MIALFYYLLCLLLIHFILLENYRRWFLKLKKFSIGNESRGVTFSVIVPARNEKNNIERCLRAILQQQYPAQLFEVIVVDDFSEDATSEIVENLKKEFAHLRLIKLADLVKEKSINSYKKKAIEMAVHSASGDWIVTTDADCIVSDQWLAGFAQYIHQSDALFIAAPVQYEHTGTFVSLFQCLDFMSLQGITAASVSAGFHTMCNGANLAYQKAVFLEVGGFKGVDNIASGDDMLLMHKVYVKHPQKVHYLHAPASIVKTYPMPTWKAFFNQRIRWASKADKFSDQRIFIVLAFIYLFNLTLFLLPFLIIWYPATWWYFPAMIIAKTLIELRFMFPVARFFDQVNWLWWFPVMQPVHIIYTVTAGWLGKFGKYSWKGRVVK